MTLSGRRVVLGVSGGIAAYKAAILARTLMEAGAEVRVVMTPAAAEFVGPPTFAGLTGHPVLTSLTAHHGSVSPHTDLARWADLVVVAPATAATLSRIANALSEEPVSATVLARRSPLLVAPAMHTEMWENPATRRIVEQLLADGVHIVGPASGPLAGGDVGPGRMAEPLQIVEAVRSLLSADLAGKKVLVTAGGTREPIDPVRYIGNRSSGKMGHAIAEEAFRRGAGVTLVTTSPIPSSPGIDRIEVETAEEMAAAVEGVAPDVAVLAAAVADFRPGEAAHRKLQRSAGPPTIELRPTVDILASVASRSQRPFLVGFAAETGGIERAIEKAREKGVDLLVANDVTEEGSGFGTETNRVHIVGPDGEVDHWPLMQKTEVARRLWDVIAARIR